LPSETFGLDEEIPFIAEVIKGGRVTIPEEIRTLMNIVEGNYVLLKLKVMTKNLPSKNPKEKTGGNGGSR